jgi:hypothetical protein
VKTDLKEQATIRQYLLGQASEVEASRVEAQLLFDEPYYEELLIAEDELIDQYLSDVLSLAEREQFEAHFLAAPERHQKLRFARSLRRYVASAATETRPDSPGETAKQVTRERQAGFGWNWFKNLFRRPVPAFALIVAVLLVGAVTWQVSRFTGPARQPGKVYAAVLTPGLVRDGGETTRISIPVDADTLRLRVELPSGQYESFRAALLSEDRREVFTAEGRRAADDARIVEFDVPSRMLKPGDYQLSVRGRPANGELEDVHRLPFRILK